MMTNWKFCCLSILFVTITTAPALDVQQCLTCWHKLCEDGTYNSPQNLCSCPCINATLYSASDSCNSEIGSYNNAPNNLCCPGAEHFIKTVIKPAIEPVGFTNISACSTLYNPPPKQFAEDDYEELLLDNEYVFYDVQFTCSGCIKNITIYHKFSNNMNRILTVQLWKVNRNISDNSSLLLLSENQSITFTTTSTSWFDFYQTVGEVELCFEPSDIFGITVPSFFNGIDIFAEKSTPNSQFYARERLSCNSLRNVYYLNSIAKRPLIAIGVSESVQATSSTVDLLTSSTSVPGEESSNTLSSVSAVKDTISPTPSLSAGTYPTNTQLLLAVVLPSIIIVVIIPFIIIILVCICLLFTRYKKTLSLNDDVVTTTVDPVTSTNPSYIPANTIDYSYVSDTGIYMDINESYKNVLSPTVKIEENPAYGKELNDDYI